MESKTTGIVRSILWGAGIILLIGAALDVTPIEDNTMIFLALACFVVSAVIKRAGKSGGCCK